VRTLGGEICLRGKLFNLSGPSFVAPNAPAASAAGLVSPLDRRRAGTVGLDQQKMLTPPGPISSPMMMRTMP
jgi:hypothetical protein